MKKEIRSRYSQSLLIHDSDSDSSDGSVNSDVMKRLVKSRYKQLYIKKYYIHYYFAPGLGTVKSLKPCPRMRNPVSLRQRMKQGINQK